MEDHHYALGKKVTIDRPLSPFLGLLKIVLTMTPHTIPDDKLMVQAQLSERTACTSRFSAVSSFETTEPHPKGVTFGDVEIRQYENILGDNPAVSGGPPLTIDWTPMEACTLSVDAHQALKRYADEEKPPPMSTEFRITYLLQSYSVSEIQRAQFQTRSIQQSRLSNRRDAAAEPLLLWVEKCRRYSKRRTQKHQAAVPGSAEAWLQDYKQASKAGAR